MQVHWSCGPKASGFSYRTTGFCSYLAQWAKDWVFGLRSSNYRRNAINHACQKIWGGLIKKTFGLVHTSYSLPVGQAVQVTLVTQVFYDNVQVQIVFYLFTLTLPFCTVLLRLLNQGLWCWLQGPEQQDPTLMSYKYKYTHPQGIDSFNSPWSKISKTYLVQIKNNISAGIYSSMESYLYTSFERAGNILSREKYFTL